jgi:enoyl-CoA hydratase
MSEQDAVLTERRDGVLLVTFNRPDARNSVNAALANAVAAAMQELDADDDLQVGVLTGAGKGFSAGMDTRGQALSRRGRRRTAAPAPPHALPPRHGARPHR